MHIGTYAHAWQIIRARRIICPCLVDSPCTGVSAPLSRALPSKMQACWSETHTVLFTPIARCLKCLIHVTYSVNVTQLHSHISSLHKTSTFPVNALQLREVRELERMPPLVKGRARTHASHLFHPPPTQALPPPPASSWRSTQDIRSEEAGLACVRRGSGRHTGSFILGEGRFS